MKKQTGFTLIELAIVLVIIGLLLGGVLKGQELINSAKVKNMASDFRNAQVALYGYQDRYKAIPGDHSTASTALDKTKCHTDGTTACSNGNGDGVITGVWNSTTPTDESFLYWNHLRVAGFLPGATQSESIVTDPPKNSDGGRIGITGGSGGNNPITGLKGTYIFCSDGVLGKFAKQLDATLDDGHTDKGSVMVTTAGVTVATAPIAEGTIDDATPYLVCMGF